MITFIIDVIHYNEVMPLDKTVNTYPRAYMKKGVPKARLFIIKKYID